jgi:hypothetical protein
MIRVQEAEEAAIAKENKLAAQAEAREAAAAAAAADQILKSPSDYSCHSYELFVGQEKGNDDNNKERMSIRSVESISEHRVKISSNSHNVNSTTTKVRKVSAVSYKRSMTFRHFTPHPVPSFICSLTTLSLARTAYLCLLHSLSSCILYC